MSKVHSLVYDLMVEALKNKLITEYDIRIIRTFEIHTQREFMLKITRNKFSLISCLEWYNSYSNV